MPSRFSAIFAVFLTFFLFASPLFAQSAQDGDRRTRLGLRVAPNMAIANLLVVSSAGSLSENSNIGFGFEGGLLLDIPFSPSSQWSFNSGVNLIYRTPVNTDDYKVSEGAIAIPILARTRWSMNGRMFFSYYGLQADIAISDMPDRNAFSIVNIVFGGGYALNQNIEFDFRAVRSFDDLVDNPYQSGKHHMEQFSLGFTYMFGK